MNSMNQSQPARGTNFNKGQFLWQHKALVIKFRGIIIGIIK